MASSALYDSLVLGVAMLAVVQTEIQPGNSNLLLQVTEHLLEISRNQALVVLVSHRRVWGVAMAVVAAAVVCLIQAIQVC